MKGLFVFRRDLRVVDNTGLYDLLDKCNAVYCIFILDPKQISPKLNKYFSMNAALFMVDSLINLKSKILLTITSGNPTDVIELIVNKYDIDIVAVNADYTPYSKERDASIEKKLLSMKKLFIKYKDVCLNSPEDIKPYKVFTPYYEVAKKIKVEHPKTTKKINNIKKLSGMKDVNLSKLKKSIEKICIDKGVKLQLVQPGGRDNGIKQLAHFKRNMCSKYANNRDLLNGETSNLGPHIKFGTLSIREVYHACSTELFRRQLYWRDFYHQIGFHFPEVYGNNFKHIIKWENDNKKFKKWCNGETGYLIVDACMKQMNASGFMPNRGRMIVASFLTKILHIDWRWGEKYFASRLTDYDPANNNGGWQWSAGTGVDAQPYFRIFNPFTQADNYDKTGEYRDKWLGNDWRDESNKSNESDKYIVDYNKERVRALKLIKN